MNDILLLEISEYTDLEENHKYYAIRTAHTRYKDDPNCNRDKVEPYNVIYEMEKISDYVNNNLNLGCGFAIG